MKKILFLILFSICVVEASAETVSFNLLDSMPKKESAVAESSVSSVPKPVNNTVVLANKNNKVVKKHKTKHRRKSSRVSYNQSYDVNAVFLQQQQQAQEMIVRANQINDAAQRVAKDAAVQAQKTQELINAQQAAQASANATLSSANQLNELSMALQKNVNNVASPDGNQNGNLSASESHN